MLEIRNSLLLLLSRHLDRLDAVEHRGKRRLVRRRLGTEIGDRRLARLELRSLPRDRLLLRGRRGFQGLDLLRLLAELAVPLLGGGEVLAAAEAVDAEVASVSRAEAVRLVVRPRVVGLLERVEVVDWGLLIDRALDANSGEVLRCLNLGLDDGLNAGLYRGNCSYRGRSLILWLAVALLRLCVNGCGWMWAGEGWAEIGEMKRYTWIEGIDR